MAVIDMEITLPDLACTIRRRSKPVRSVRHSDTGQASRQAAALGGVLLGSGVGFSTCLSRKQEMSAVLKHIRAQSPTGYTRSSDVTGMDWSVGGSGMLHVYRAWQVESAWSRALWAYGYAEFD